MFQSELNIEVWLLLVGHLRPKGDVKTVFAQAYIY